MKTIIAAVISLILLVHTTSAQYKNFHVSARVGNLDKGLSARWFVSDNGALDAMFTVEPKMAAWKFTALYEQHQGVWTVPNLNWFAGAGLHIGYNTPPLTAVLTPSPDEVIIVRYEDQDKSKAGKVIAGMNMILGLEYLIPKTPVFIGAEIKPGVNVLNEESFLFDAAVRLGVAF